MTAVRASAATAKFIGIIGYLDTTEAEEADQQPGRPDGVAEEEEEQDKRGRDDEHERRLGLQLHHLGVRVLLPTQGNIALLGRLQQQRHFSALAARSIGIRFVLCVCTNVRTSSPTTATVHTEAQATVPTAIIQRKGMAPSKDGFSGAYMRMSTACMQQNRTMDG